MNTMEENKMISQEELEQWIQRAEEGDCEMQYQLGEYYYTGAKKDYRRALAYYLQAAEAGHALAQRRAGEMYMSGKKIGKNMNEATKWSTLAAEQGDIVAHYQLGECYWEGKKQDKNRAFDHYFLAAKAGYVPALQSIGEIIHSKGLDSKRLAEALKWVDSAAEQGNAEMQFQLGELYRTGNKKDTTRALKYHKMAAEAGHESAQLELGRMYLYVKEVINYNEAIKWLTLSAEQGNAWAQLDLGHLYQHNKKVRNFDEAIKWLTLAADHLAPASESLALIYYQIKDKEKALYWATRSVTDTLVKLGEKYLEDKDLENAETFFCKATEKHKEFISSIADAYEENSHDQKAFEWRMRGVAEGVEEVKCQIGRMYEEGIGIEKDINQAFYWYARSVEEDDDTEGKLYLARCYELGRGVKADLEEATDLLFDHLDHEFYMSSMAERLLLRIALKTKSEKYALQEKIEYLEYKELQRDINQYLHYYSDYLEKTTTQEELDFWTSEAEQGDVEAQQLLGVYYAISREYDDAIEWLTKAAEQGDTLAEKLLDLNQLYS